MTKRKPTQYNAENANDAEIQRLTDEITILKAQLAAKSIHDQWCPHYKKATTSPTTGQPIGPESGPPRLQPYSDPPKGWVSTVLIDSPLRKPREKKHKAKQEMVKNFAGTELPQATCPKEKEWNEDNFRAAIQHWDFDWFRKNRNTPEAIDEAEAALYDLNSGSYDGWEERERERRVAGAVFGGMMRMMMEYRYFRFDHPDQFRSPPGTPGTITLYLNRSSQELPAWFLSHGFKIEDDTVFIEGSEEELEKHRKRCSRG